MEWTHLLTSVLLVVSTARAKEPAIAGYWTCDALVSDGAAAARRIDAGEGRWHATQDSAPPREQPEPIRALLAEALQVQQHLTIAPVDAHAVLIVDGAGISRLYQTDGTAERHEFEAGVAMVRTVWVGAELRQTFELAPETRVTRTLRTDAPRGRLVEMLSVERRGVARTRPLIRIYASDRLE